MTPQIDKVVNSGFAVDDSFVKEGSAHMIVSRRQVLAGGSVTLLGACILGQQTSTTAVVEVFNSSLAEVIDTDQTFDVLGEGYKWSEGPAWDAQRQQLYFTDVPENKAFVWQERSGVRLFLEPSGARPEETRGFREPGANGLMMGQDGRLLVCNHGRRAIEALDLATGEREALATEYRDRRFNSPNDLVQASDGVIYFTDPPYGLEGLDASPLKEQDANGVYRLAPDGDVTRLLDDMTFPNGIVLSVDEQYLLISQSDPKAPLIRRIKLSDTSVDETWFDASPYMNGKPGLPDGMVVAETGHVLATGPGGVFILAPNGQALGRINPGSASANCTFGEDGRTLFITAQDRLLRMRTKVRGASWG